MLSSRTWRARAFAASSASTSAESRHAAGARGGRLRALPGKGLRRCVLPRDQRLLAQHRRPARAAGEGFPGDPSGRLARRARSCATRHGKRVPLVLKIAPDLDADDIRAIAEAVRRERHRGRHRHEHVRLARGVENLLHANEAGGLSGAPIRRRATRVLNELSLCSRRRHAHRRGRDLDRARMRRKSVRAGAALVQLYTGLIYRGPNLVARVECVRYLPMKRAAVALIDESRCIGCTLCIDACPVDAIVGARSSCTPWSSPGASAARCARRPARSIASPWCPRGRMERGAQARRRARTARAQRMKQKSHPSRRAVGSRRQAHPRRRARAQDAR